MKAKKEYWILVLLITGLALYLLFHKRDRTGYEMPVLQELSASQITKIEIARPGAPAIALERKNDAWILPPEAYPADAGKMEALLGSIGKLTLTTLVSESQNYVRYGLGKEERISVRAWAGDKLSRDFEVGKADPSAQSTFILLRSDSRVFQARGHLKARFDQTLDDLRDKDVFKVEPSGVEALEVSDGKRTLILSRKATPGEEGEGQTQTAWESAEGKVDESKVNQLLNALSGLKCRAYLYEEKKSGFYSPVYSVKVKSKEEHGLSLYAKSENSKNDFPAVSSQNDSPFLLSDHQAKLIMVPLDQIVKP
ncbi:MAG: DUF4340 domain-containing protein [Deltaproteobacteria bacterium]